MSSLNNNGRVVIEHDDEAVSALNALPINQPEITETNIHTGNKEIRTFQENHICNENTTSTLLGANEIFLGEWQDALNFVEIRVSVISDQDSIINGLEFQWSHDGIDFIDGVEDNFSIKANKGKSFSTPNNWRYFRIKYTNGPIAQTKFYLTTQMDRVASKGSMHRIQDSIVADDDAVLTKSVVTGEDDDGVFRNVKTDYGNNLRVNSFPYTYSIAEGDIAGHKALLKFGTRTNTSTTESTIWKGTANRYPYISTATQLSVVSTSGSDSAAGTGIRTLTLSGLDSNWDEVSETITMNGTTPVLTTNSYIRIFRAFGATSGTSQTNVGTINVTASGVQVLVISPNDGQTLMALWTVPSGKVAYVTNGSFSTNSNKGSRMSLYVRLNDGGLYPWRIQYRAFVFSGNENFPFTIPFKVPEKTDIEVRTIQASVGADCGATFELWYEDV